MPITNTSNSRYLWIKNLPNRTNIDDLTAILQSFGRISSIQFNPGANSNTNNNCQAKTAIVTCKEAAVAAKILEVGLTLHKTNLELQFCDSKGHPFIHDTSAESSKSSTKRNPHRSRSTSIDSSFEDVSRSKGGHSSESRGLAVSNLPKRSSSNNLREGLFHEFKKFGKITSVIIEGQGPDRVAIITFKRGEDADKAYESSQNKVFFRTQIKVEKTLGAEVEDPDLCPPEHVMDEYHPKATKTLFVGNLCANTITKEDLHEVFEKYGEIIEIDIKIQANQLGTSYAFVQYGDIKCVVAALNNQENIRVKNKTVKLGFGKSQPTNVVWLDNLASGITDNFLKRHFSRFGRLSYVILDEKLLRALLYFDNPEIAQRALNETRNRPILNRKVQIDFASQECQIAFIRKTGENNAKTKGSSEKLQQLSRLLRFNSNYPLFEEKKGLIDCIPRDASSSGAESDSPSLVKKKDRSRHRNLTPISTTSGDANYSPSSDSNSSSLARRTGQHSEAHTHSSSLRHSGNGGEHRARSRNHSHRRYCSTERSDSIVHPDYEGSHAMSKAPSKKLIISPSDSTRHHSSSASKTTRGISPPLAYTDRSLRETSQTSRSHHSHQSRSRMNGSLPKSYSKAASSTSGSRHGPRSGDDHSPVSCKRSQKSDTRHMSNTDPSRHHYPAKSGEISDHSGHHRSKKEIFELSPTSSSASIKSQSRNYLANHLDYRTGSNTLLATAKKLKESTKATLNPDVNELSKLNKEKAALLRELSLLAGHTKSVSKSRSPSPIIFNNEPRNPAAVNDSTLSQSTPQPSLAQPPIQEVNSILPQEPEEKMETDISIRQSPEHNNNSSVNSTSSQNVLSNQIRPPSPPKSPPSEPVPVVTPPPAPIKREDKLNSILTGADYHPLAQAFLKHSSTEFVDVSPTQPKPVDNKPASPKVEIKASEQVPVVKTPPKIPSGLDSVDERIRLLDQELMKTEKVRPVVDYSKFRIRRKNQNPTNPPPTTTTAALHHQLSDNSILNSTTTNIGFDLYRSASLLNDINSIASPTSSIPQRIKRLKSPSSVQPSPTTLDSNDFIKSMLSSTKTTSQTIPSLYSNTKPITASSWSNAVSTKIPIVDPFSPQPPKPKSPVAHMSTNEMLKRLEEDFKRTPKEDPVKPQSSPVALETKPPKRDSFENPNTVKTEPVEPAQPVKSRKPSNIYDTKVPSLKSHRIKCESSEDPPKVLKKRDPEKTSETKVPKPTTTNRLPWELKPDNIISTKNSTQFNKEKDAKAPKLHKVKKSLDGSSSTNLDTSASTKSLHHKTPNSTSKEVSTGLKKKRDMPNSAIPTKKRRLLSSSQDSSSTTTTNKEHRNNSSNLSDKILKKKFTKNISSSSYESSSNDETTESMLLEHQRNFNLYESMYDKIKRRASKDNPAAIVSNVLERQHAHKLKHGKKGKFLIMSPGDSDNEDSHDESQLRSDDEGKHKRSSKEHEANISAFDRQNLLKQLSVSSTSSSDEGFIPKTPSLSKKKKVHHNHSSTESKKSRLISKSFQEDSSSHKERKKEKRKLHLQQQASMNNTSSHKPASTNTSLVKKRKHLTSSKSLDSDEEDERSTPQVKRRSSKELKKRKLVKQKLNDSLTSTDRRTHRDSEDNKEEQLPLLIKPRCYDSSTDSSSPKISRSSSEEEDADRLSFISFPQTNHNETPRISTDKSSLKADDEETSSLLLKTEEDIEVAPKEEISIGDNAIVVEKTNQSTPQKVEEVPVAKEEPEKKMEASTKMETSEPPSVVPAIQPIKSPEPQVQAPPAPVSVISNSNGQPTLLITSNPAPFTPTVVSAPDPTFNQQNQQTFTLLMSAASVAQQSTAMLSNLVPTSQAHHQQMSTPLRPAPTPGSQNISPVVAPQQPKPVMMPQNPLTTLATAAASVIQTPTSQPKSMPQSNKAKASVPASVNSSSCSSGANGADLSTYVRNVIARVTQEKEGQFNGSGSNSNHNSSSNNMNSSLGNSGSSSTSNSITGSHKKSRVSKKQLQQLADVNSTPFSLQSTSKALKNSSAATSSSLNNKTMNKVVPIAVRPQVDPYEPNFDDDPNIGRKISPVTSTPPGQVKGQQPPFVMMISTNGSPLPAQQQPPLSTAINPTNQTPITPVPQINLNNSTSVTQAIPNPVHNNDPLMSSNQPTSTTTSPVQNPPLPAKQLANGANIDQLTAQFGVNPLAYIYSLFAQQQKMATTTGQMTPGTTNISITGNNGALPTPGAIPVSMAAFLQSQQSKTSQLPLQHQTGVTGVPMGQPISSVAIASTNAGHALTPGALMQSNQPSNSITLDFFTSALVAAAAQQQPPPGNLQQPQQARPPNNPTPSQIGPPMISILSPQRLVSVPTASSPVQVTPLSAVSFPDASNTPTNPVQLLNSMYESSISPNNHQPPPSNPATTTTIPSATYKVVNLPSNESVVTNFTSVWRGRLLLKNEEFQSQMFHLSGNADLFNLSLRTLGNDAFCKTTLDQYGRSGVLKIVQRMRFDPKQLEGVNRKLRQPSDHVVCLALSEPKEDQQTVLKNSFIRYLNEKSAAGIINVTHPMTHENLYIIHIFPPCEFSSAQFKDIPSGPLLFNALNEKSIPYLMVIVTTV